VVSLFLCRRPTRDRPSTPLKTIYSAPIFSDFPFCPQCAGRAQLFCKGRVFPAFHRFFFHSSLPELQSFLAPHQGKKGLFCIPVFASWEFPTTPPPPPSSGVLRLAEGCKAPAHSRWSLPSASLHANPCSSSTPAFFCRELGPSWIISLCDRPPF